MHLKETIKQAIFEKLPRSRKRDKYPVKKPMEHFSKNQKLFRAEIGILSKYSAFVQVEELKLTTKTHRW